MSEFDYKRAWAELAKPAYLALPQYTKTVLEAVANICHDMHQQDNLSMQWTAPLRDYFGKINTPDLALASRVIYVTGHWFPTGGDLDLPGRNHGAHWKFSNYADQALRSRLGVAGETPFQIHEGVIRLCYSSRDMWTWTEVAPATEEGLERAKELCSEFGHFASNSKTREQRDHAAWQFHNALKTRIQWPSGWEICNTQLYMS